MSYIVICREEFRSLKVDTDDPLERDIGDAQGVFDFLSEAQKHIEYIEGRTEPRKAGLICPGPHVIFRVEKPMDPAEARQVDEYIRRLEEAHRDWVNT